MVGTETIIQASNNIKAELVKTTSSLVFFVNGKKVVDDSVDPEWTLLHYLRTKLRLTGTKLVCGEGGCGACTVMVSKYDRQKDKITHLAVNACLAPVCAMHGLAVTTVEGIGSTRTKLHPIQERLVTSHGSQCGFCTPGFVMSMYTLLRNSPTPSMEDIQTTLQGNLCRCTGYRAIIEGFKMFTCGMGDKCCKLQCTNGDAVTTSGNNNNDFTPYDSTQEPIFPPELKMLNKFDLEYLTIKGASTTWFRPITLQQLLDLKSIYPEAKIIGGNTEVGIEVKLKNKTYPILINPYCIKELTKIDVVDKGIRIGGCATLSEIDQFLKQQIQKLPEEKTRIYQQMVQMFHWFAGVQVRNVGTIAGNIITGSPISDLVPILMANKVTVELLSKTTKRIIILDENFYVRYRESLVQPNEVILSVLVPFTNADRYCIAYKQARRRDDDIAIVNLAINVSFKPRTYVIDDLNLAFGGMSFKTVMASKTQKALRELPWNRDTLETAYIHLLEDLPLDPGAPGGMVTYRQSLSLSLFFKAFLAVASQLNKKFPEIFFDETEMSAIEVFKYKEFKSSQYYTVQLEDGDKLGAVHRPIVHVNAFEQATGEAKYCDDLPILENELHLVFVTSTKAHARITLLDATAALQVPGVVDFICAKDTSGIKIGELVKDEEIFYNDVVTSQGQIVGAIVAKDRSTAKKASKLVKIEYEELHPIILTIQDAIAANSFYSFDPKIVRGDVDEVFKTAPNVIEGECNIGGQEHFYFETNACIVIPKGGDELEIYSATQTPTEISREIARITGLPQNKVITKIQRIGGGFGGKESKSIIIAAPVAIAARKLRCPIRCTLDRDEDMEMTAGRHPFLIKHKTAFDNNGKLLASDIKLYNNAGYCYDFSQSVMEKALTHIENAYSIPVVRACGYLCKTNLPSNTAFRGFGGPQGLFGAEIIIEDVADYLNIDVTEVRQLNLHKSNDLTIYNQEILNSTMDKCWKEVIKNSNYYERKKAVDKFNKLNKYKKRGLSLIPTKYGTSIVEPFLNQGGALVLIYTDGSVLLHHGGVEMGQGLYTKMIQIASTALGVPMDKIYTSETSTSAVPNTSPTAGSATSDLNGMAILYACQKINQRLQPYKEKYPNETWEQWCERAYFDRVSLAATGFYKTPNLGYDWEKAKGVMFSYFSWGAACCEVEIDSLTGDHQVHRVDIVMDVGNSLNPAIDVGQIEGAFMQGYGLFTLEELLYSPEGALYTKGPSTYKIPSLGDIPEEFNVSILKGVSNPRAVYSSKGIGEPPLFLGSSVFFAIKDAIKAARFENGITTPFRLNSPATAAKIRMACCDNITSKIKEPIPGSFKPWNVVA